MSARDPAPSPRRRAWRWTVGRRAASYLLVLTALMVALEVHHVRVLDRITAEIRQATEVETLSLVRLLAALERSHAVQTLALAAAKELAAAGRAGGAEWRRIAVRFERHGARVDEALRELATARPHAATPGIPPGRTEGIAESREERDPLRRLIGRLARSHRLFHWAGVDLLRHLEAGRSAAAWSGHERLDAARRETDHTLARGVAMAVGVTEEAVAHARTLQVEASRLKTLTLLGLLAIAAVAALAVRAARKIDASLRRLSEGAGRVAATIQTDHPAVERIPVRTSDEVGELTARFNELAETLVESLAQRRVAEAEARRLAGAIEQTTDIVILADAAGRIRYANRSGRAMLALGHDDLSRTTLTDIHVGGARAALLGEACRAAACDGIWTGELTWMARDGRAVPTSTVLIAHRAPDGAVEYVSIISRDITRQKLIAAELAAARDRALEAAALKQEFLANVSHELRTPMNGILGMTEILLDTPLTSEQREFAETTRRCAQSLLSIINDLLDLSGLATGHARLQAVPFRLREHLRDTLALMGPLASRKGLRLTGDVPPEVPDLLAGDPDRLRQVLVNLLGNAVKFTERGEVVVRVRGGADAEGAATLHVAVADTGIGIPAEKQGVIFDAFAQADSSATRRYGGPGLGLTLCARLVELMGGRIWVESAVGKGATFHFTARLALGAETARPSDERPEVTPLRILLADDDPIDREMVQRMLETHGHTVTCAENGVGALEAFRDDPSDVVLMDVRMPIMDGLAATAAIRARARATGRPVGVVALTGLTREEDRARCLAAGMDAFVTKPIERGELLAAIERVAPIHRSEASAGGADAAGAPAPAPRALPPTLDIESLCRLVGEDPSLLLDTVRMFQVDSRRLLGDIRDGLARGDTAAVERARDQLRASADTLAAFGTRRVARRLDRVGRDDGARGTEDTVAAVEREMERLEAAVRALTATPDER